MAVDLLLWVKSQGFTISLIVFFIGTIARIVHFIIIGEKKDLSKPRNTNLAIGGLGTVFRRFLPTSQWDKQTALVFISGYIFHIGFFVVLLLFVPHIEFFQAIINISWPGLPSGIVNMITAVTMLSLLIILFNRIVNPVRRLLSDFQDYLIWVLTFIPLITGYMAYNHLFAESYTLILAIHILSVEIMLVLFPFTRLSHSFTLFFSRWYSGASSWRKGVKI